MAGKTLRCHEGLELTRRARALGAATVGGGHAREALTLDEILTVWRAVLERRAERIRRALRSARQQGRKAQ